jgi:hypothetical protein
MQSFDLGQHLKLPLLAALLTIAVVSFLSQQSQFGYSQTLNANSTANATSSGVDLRDTHPIPASVNAGSQLQILSTVVNNSPNAIQLPAGACDSPLSAFFKSNNVITKYGQGCSAKSPLFKLEPGKEVTIAGPPSGTIYQAVKAGKVPGDVTVVYQTENGQPAKVTKPFIFTVNP